ncbi:MAG: 3-deoxy-7-phosphoheptulonate synthase [Bacteroidetes bacterium]|nr:MAG: 3-deoxy-7-phosphoheptulonate synthase [Bacteroidota bacterium]
MIVVMKSGAKKSEIQSVLKKIKEIGLKPHVSAGIERTIIGIIGDERLFKKEQFSMLSGVENVIPVLKPYKLASRDFKKTTTVVNVNGVNIGGNNLVTIAGPCSVETKEQLLKTAHIVKKAGAQLLRGGAYKPRTSPYAFQGLGKDGLKILAAARKETGLGIVTEVMESQDAELVAEYADMIQVGARNMQNTKLLRTLGKIKKPILLKRNFSATLNEFLMSAEYLLSGGNENVVLCERGIRTFVEYTRNTFDLNVIPVVKQLSHLPIIADPSHATGRQDIVIPMSRAAIAAGADGLIIEVHTNPAEAFSDGDQSITPSMLEQLMSEVQAVAHAVGREM